MSLRVHLFLLLAGLLALLMGAQWWLIQSLARDLGTEVSAVAFSVGQELVEVLQDSEMESEISMEAGSGTTEVDVRVIQIEEKQVEGQKQSESRQRIVHIVRPGDAGPLSPEMAEELEALTAGGLLPGPGPEPPKAKLPDVRPPGSETDPFFLEVMRSGGPEDDALVLKGPRVVRKIPIPLQSFDNRLDRFRERLWMGSLVLLALGLALAALVAHRVSRPLRSLAAAAQRVGEGEQGVRVAEGVGGEVGATLKAFNLMSDRLVQLEGDARRLREAQHLTELGEVSQGFAHSLRNPLNALGLSVDTLAEKDVEESQRLALASTARQQIRRVDEALRSFLAVASSGGEPEEVDLATLLQDVALEAMQDCQGQKGNDQHPPRLEVHTAPPLPALRAVAPELRSVLQALVINAMEASPPGGRVTLSAEALSENRVRILVEDEGPGLPAAVREKLFKPHVTTKAHGSGMGLFLAHRISSGRYEGSLNLHDLAPEDGAKEEDSRTGTRAVLELSHRISPNASTEMGSSTHG